MFNLNELWNYLNVPGTVEKMQRWGDVIQYALPWAAISILAFTGDTAAAWAWLYGCAATMLLVTVFKNLFNLTPLGRRPNGGKNSFPSGHTAGATLGAAFILFQFGLLAAIVPIVLAVVTGVSRIVSNNHWPRDVIAGAAIATAVMYYFMH